MTSHLKLLAYAIISPTGQLMCHPLNGKSLPEDAIPLWVDDWHAQKIETLIKEREEILNNIRLHPISYERKPGLKS